MAPWRAATTPGRRGPSVSHCPVSTTSVRTSRSSRTWRPARRGSSSAGRSRWRSRSGATRAGATSGWDSVRRINRITNKKARITFRRPYAPYKVMLAQSLYPQHALTGTNFNEVWNNNYNHPRTGASMASGPYKLQSYTRGQNLVMVRNNTYFGKRPTLDRITFRFITNTDSEIQAIRGGEVDIIYPQPQLQLAQLRGQSGLRTVANAGSTLEHIDINMGQGNSNPLLAQRWFRQAIAYSLDRRAMVNQLFRTLKAGLPVLQNNTFTNQQRGQ